MGHQSGGPRASDILTRAVEICADGRWHDHGALVRELSKMVPPGRAMRRAESNRVKGGGTPERTNEAQAHRILESGRRSIVKEFVRKPWFETDPPGRQPQGTRLRVRLVKVPASIAAYARKDFETRVK
jgi:hypothetical protein